MNDVRDGDNGGGRKAFYQRPIGMIIIGASSLLAIFAIVFGILAGFVWPNNVTSAGNKIEHQMMVDYRAAASSLHRCKANSAAAANVAQAQQAALDDVLNHTIGGSYGNAKKGSLNTSSVATTYLGRVYPVNLYPDQKSAAAAFQRVLTIAAGCQDNFLRAENVVGQDVQNLRDFRDTSWMNRSFGGLDFPNQDLYINLPGVPFASGQAALLIMDKPIIDTDTAGAFSTGMDNGSLQGPFPSSSPSASSSTGAMGGPSPTALTLAA